MQNLLLVSQHLVFYRTHEKMEYVNLVVCDWVYTQNIVTGHNFINVLFITSHIEKQRTFLVQKCITRDLQKEFINLPDTENNKM